VLCVNGGENHTILDPLTDKCSKLQKTPIFFLLYRRLDRLPLTAVFRADTVVRMRERVKSVDQTANDLLGGHYSRRLQILHSISSGPALDSLKAWIAPENSTNLERSEA
jgi:hypothetical protein